MPKVEKPVKIPKVEKAIKAEKAEKVEKADKPPRAPRVKKALAEEKPKLPEAELKDQPKIRLTDFVALNLQSKAIQAFGAWSLSRLGVHAQLLGPKTEIEWIDFFQKWKDRTNFR